MRRTRTCPCDALPTVTLIRIRFRRLALDTFNMELRDIQADRDKHLREHEAATQALLEERRKLNMEREAAMADQAAKERELTDVAREQAEKAGQLASEQSAMSYERKMLDRERGELERELETLVRPHTETLHLQRSLELVLHRMHADRRKKRHSRQATVLRLKPTPPS